MMRFAALVALPLLMVQTPAAAEFRLDGRATQGGLLRGVAPAGTTALTLDGDAVPLAGDGHFLIAFDRDHDGPARLDATLADGRVLSETLAVAPRAWPIQHLNIARRPAAIPDETYRRMRAAELERIGAARAGGSDSEGWRQGFVWPAGGRISGRFGAQRFYRGEPAAYHSGVDVAPGAGAPVVAPADGVVTLAGGPAFSLEGNLVILDHGMGLNSAFLHLASVAVSEGDQVRQGQPIGTVGATGRATGPHLHWSLMWSGRRLDPEPLAEGR